MMQEYIEQFKTMEFFGNPAESFAWAAFIFVVSLLILKIFQLLIIGRLRNLAQKTKTDMDDVFIEIVSNVKPPLYLVVAIFISLRYLSISEMANKALFIFLVIVILLELVRAFERLLGYYVERYVRKTDKDEADKIQVEAAAKMMRTFVVIALWIMATLMILSNLGINVTSLIASMGIGGIAIALAAQNILGDMFSSFSIFLDKPFKVGDTITVGTDSGKVEKIGLKTTRVRTLRGEQLIISNNELTSTRVQNMRRMENRRDLFLIGVAYETPKEKLDKIPTIVEKLIKGIEKTEFGRCFFAEYGDFSLNFEIMYHVTTPDYDDFVKVKHEVNMAIFEALQKEGIDFAYPTQKILLEK